MMRNRFHCAVLVTVVANLAVAQASHVSASPGINAARAAMRRDIVRAAQQKHKPIVKRAIRSLLSISNGSATAVELHKAKVLARRMLKSDAPSQVDAASAIAATLYLFDKDLDVARVYTKRTGQPFRAVSLWSKFAIADAQLANYLAWAILKTAQKSANDYYRTGNVRVTLPIGALRTLESLPQTPMVTRVMLNYPFEFGAPTMMLRYVGDMRIPDVPGGPKSPMQLYFNKFIRGKSYEHQFIRNLSRRNLLSLIDTEANTKRRTINKNKSGP